MHKNNQLTELILELRRASVHNEVGVWRAIADDLERPTRRHAQVNLARLARATTQGETVVVPGKVLGDGELTHAITIAALGFSTSATTKLKASKATIVDLRELVKRDPKGASVRIIA